MVAISSWKDYPNIKVARRITRYLIIWCQDGEADVEVDDEVFKLRKGCLLTVTSGQIHRFTAFDQGEGLILEFTLEFFCKDDSDIELVFQNGIFCHFDINEVVHMPDKSFVEQLLSNIQNELTHKSFQYLASIHARIKLLLVEINRAKISSGYSVWKPEAVFLKFLELVRANFDKNLTTEDFSKLLGTTKNKLNDQAKLHTGKTAQMVISSLKMAEAKRLILHDKLSIKEIAYQLGFSDPFYFSNFFKKHTGKSPKSYQDSIMI